MKKYLAQIIIEATTPLVVGSGKSSLDNDAVIARDWNNLPYIPGTGILGVLRSMFENKYTQDQCFKIFGGKDKETKNEGTFKGADFEISDALLVDGDDENGRVLQAAVSKSEFSNYYKQFLKLPKREHAKIDFKGVVADTGKFDNEFVYKGARFKMEIELQGEDIDKYWNFILNSFYSSDFLLGSGTTNGYGQIKPVTVKTKIYDLKTKIELEAYLNHTVDLNNDFNGKEHSSKSNGDDINNWKEFEITNLVINAIHIGAGYGDSEVDDVNYTEQVIVWGANNKYEWKEYNVIPGSSIKGVISHRVAYLHNKANNKTIESIIENAKTTLLDKEKADIDKPFAEFEKQFENLKLDTKETENLTIEFLKKKLLELDNLKKEINDFEYSSGKLINVTDLLKNYVGENNEKVKELFGLASNKDEKGAIGKVIFNDIYIPDVIETIFTHNKIDRFTGGTIDTALYEEKVFVTKKPIKISYKVYKETSDATLQEVIDNLKEGNLAIGGKTNKGYGYFTQKTT